MKYPYTRIKILSLFTVILVLSSCGSDPIHKDIEEAEDAIPQYEPNLEYGLNLDFP